MVVCPRCGHRNESGANYCSSCGTSLAHGDEATLSLSAVVEPEGRGVEPIPGLADLPDGTGLVVVERGPNAGSTYRVGETPVAAGRHPDSDIFLDDITVSRRHAVFQGGADGFVVRDVGSLNGLYVNHDRVDEAALADGDEIQVGRYVLRFHVGSRRDG